jgi:hypothetical protein
MLQRIRCSLGYTIVIYIGFCFVFSDSAIIGFRMYEVDTVFFMLLHFYNIKIKLKLITMYTILKHVFEYKVF